MVSFLSKLIVFNSVKVELSIGIKMLMRGCFTIDDAVLGDNKPIWMQAEEREENKVSLLFS